MATTSEVLLKARADFKEVESSLSQLTKSGETLQEGLAQSGEKVGETLGSTTKKTERFLGGIRDMGRRVADQLRSDFKTLLSLEAVQQSLSVTNQFKDSIGQSITLSDTVRKLGNVFDLTGDKFKSFQNNLTKGLGEVGLSSEVATNTLQALAQTPVRGQDALIEYSKIAGQLASFSGQQGQEGSIAAGLANVIKAQGGDVEDVDEIKRVAEDLRRAFNVTGIGPTQTIKQMQTLFEQMPQDMRESISTRGLANLSAVSQAAGPGSTKFLEEFLTQSKLGRLPQEAQGLKGIFSNEGLDIEQFRKVSSDIMGRIGGDPTMAAQTLGISEEAAKGFVRLAENLDKVAEVQAKVASQTGSVNDQYQRSLGLGEAFRANLNRVKSALSEPLTFLTEGATNLLGKASESDMGAAGVAAGGGLLAATLAGFGLKGIGKGLGIGGMATGLAKKEAIEGITGEEVQNVYVTNASEIGSGVGTAVAGAGGMLGKAGGFLKGAAGVGIAGAAGYGVGSLIQGQIEQRTQGKTKEGFEGNIIEQGIFKMMNLFGAESAKKIAEANQALNTAPQGQSTARKEKFVIENRAPGFSVKKASRGANI